MFVGRAVATFGLVVVISSCSLPSQQRDPRNATRTVILVTIDTWRRDATGFLGERQPSPTPFLDTLAVRGLVATDAVAPVPHTAPSHWSMLTGRWPWRDGVRVNGNLPSAAGDRGPSLAVAMRDAGFRSAAFVSAAVLGARFGFAEGFDHYDDAFASSGALRLEALPERRGDLTVQAALDWLRSVQASERVFVWLHLFDPHFPYAAPGGEYPGEHGDYLAEVGFADQQVRRLAEGLRASGRGDDSTLWMVLSDHGEGLGEHGEETHGFLVHGATQRIPLLVAGPSIPVQRYTQLASTVDVYPTLLAAVGIAPAPGDGIDLVSGGAPADRAVPLESLYGADAFGLAPVMGLRTDRWLWEGSPDDHLWDVVDDPTESRDLAPFHRDVVERLREDREAFALDAAEGRAEGGAETLSMLRSLGYVSGGGSAGVGDVREFVLHGYAKYLEFMRHVGAQRHAEAEVAGREFLQSYPGSPVVWMHAGLVAVHRQDFVTAEERLRRAVEIAPGNTAARLNYGNVLLALQRVADAEREYRGVLERDPADPQALYNLAVVLTQRGQPTAARPLWEEFLRRHPNHAMAAQVRQSLGRGR